MKQLLYTISAVLLLTACNKKDARVFEESPEERMSTRINELNTQLLSATNGWKVSLTTSAKGGYGFYMNFDKSQSVVMVADLNTETSTKTNTSTFRIKWVMNATLIFDTYNYITMLQDPNSAVYAGTAGSGLQSDVEFEYQHSSGDTVFLRGFKYKNDMILVKATADEKNRYLGAAFKANIDEITAYFAAKQNNYVNVAGITNKIEFVPDNSTKIAKLQYVDNNGAVVMVSAKYNFEDVGVYFPHGLTVNGVTYVKGRMENGEFVLISSTGAKNVLKQNDTPILPMPVLFAYNGTYKELYIGSALAKGVTSQFNTAYTACVTKFAAMSPARTLVDVRFILANSTTATVTTRNNNGTTTFTAVASYKYTYDNGTITLSSPTYDGNWTARVAQLIDIQNYFSIDGVFKVDYVKSTDPTVVNLGGLYKVSVPDNSSFFYGTLRK